LKCATKTGKEEKFRKRTGRRKEKKKAIEEKEIHALKRTASMEGGTHFLEKWGEQKNERGKALRRKGGGKKTAAQNK